MTDPYTVRTSPRRELENLDHRRRVLERALAAEPDGTRAILNRSELEHLDDVRRGWEAERDRNRLAWCDYHERQWRNHVALARQHYVAWMQLLQEEVVASEPSANGHA